MLQRILILLVDVRVIADFVLRYGEHPVVGLGILEIHAAHRRQALVGEPVLRSPVNALPQTTDIYNTAELAPELDSLLDENLLQQGFRP